MNLYEKLLARTTYATFEINVLEEKKKIIKNNRQMRSIVYAIILLISSVAHTIMGNPILAIINVTTALFVSLNIEESISIILCISQLPMPIIMKVTWIAARYLESYLLDDVKKSNMMYVVYMSIKYMILSGLLYL